VLSVLHQQELRAQIMSVQFGRWSFDGELLPRDFCEKINTLLAPYAPDNCNFYHKDGISVIYRAFHTTRESRRELQPHISRSGAVITWDGRLDNRSEFIQHFRSSLAHDSADVSIVAAAYDQWGTGCFGKLTGDWVLSIWDPGQCALIFAKDPIGTRPLYYSAGKDQVVWSSILDPLVLFAGKTFALQEEYIAGWLSSFPDTHLTPYIGIDSVPPSCFVHLERGRRTVSKYWDFDPGNRICYRTDTEYEEHFRDVFRQAVQRRLRSDGPVLAELSGGTDSSSIVCMADVVQEAGEIQPLDTVSYYDDSEPNWNERPYFTKVEEKRGRIGCHIDTSSADTFECQLENEHFAAIPSSGKRLNSAAKQFADFLVSSGNRVLLSGIGGDEVIGGVPTPTPELGNLLTRVQLRTLARQLKVWALAKRTPWFRLLLSALLEFFPSVLAGASEFNRPAPWLDPRFVRRNRTALRGYRSRTKLFGPLPSFQENIFTIDALRRQLGSAALPSNPPYEKRYPYLDRDLLEFIFAIPREQLVRAGERRSLMRRALAGIVPDELLNRRRKAFINRAPLAAFASASATMDRMSSKMASESLGFLDTKIFCITLKDAINGREVPTVKLLRALALEAWLRKLMGQGLLCKPDPQSNQKRYRTAAACPAVRHRSQLRTTPP
jgi:asparagine synthase (glutamine-hydrolysing)